MGMKYIGIACVVLCVCAQAVPRTSGKRLVTLEQDHCGVVEIVIKGKEAKGLFDQTKSEGKELLNAKLTIENVKDAIDDKQVLTVTVGDSKDAGSVGTNEYTCTYDRKEKTYECRVTFYTGT